MFLSLAFAPAATGLGNSRKLSYSYGFFAWLSVQHAVKPGRSGRPHLAAVKRPKYRILYFSRRGFSGQAVSSLICRLPRFASIILWGRIMPGGKNEFLAPGDGSPSALLGLPSQSRHPSAFGSQQNDMVPTIVGADADDFPPVVDGKCLNQLPAAVGVQELIQIVQPMLTVEKSMEALVSLRERPADDFSPVIDIARDAE